VINSYINFTAVIFTNALLSHNQQSSSVNNKHLNNVLKFTHTKYLRLKATTHLLRQQGSPVVDKANVFEQLWCAKSLTSKQL